MASGVVVRGVGVIGSAALSGRGCRLKPALQAVVVVKAPGGVRFRCALAQRVPVGGPHREDWPALQAVLVIANVITGVIPGGVRSLRFGWHVRLGAPCEPKRLSAANSVRCPRFRGKV